MPDKSLDRQLRQAGEAPVPPPDPAFVSMLEDRLRAGALAPEPSFRAPARPARWRWPAVAAVAAAAALVVGLAGILPRDGADEVRVASATDAVIVLPDGTVDPAVPGAVIPDGSRLQTGNEGHVVVDGTELGPKQEAKVEQGTVRPSPTTVPPTPSEPSVPPGTAPTATTRPAGVTPTTSTTRPAPTTTTPPTTARPVVTSPPTTPATRPPNTKPTTETSGPARNTPAELKLDARAKGTTVKLTWSAYDGKDFAAYLVLRTDGPADPSYPVDDRTTVVARITDPRTTAFAETIADPAGRRYRVVAVDGDRRLIARSAAVSPQPLG